MAEVPEPLIKCLLPEYEDRHYQWLIGQYLERSGFQATLATFSLELNAKGYRLEDSVKLDEEVLRKHFACMLTRQLVGPSAVVPVHSGSSLQQSAGTPANGMPTALLQLTSNGTAAHNEPHSTGQKQPHTAAGHSARPGSVSPMDVCRQKPHNFDQAQQHNGHDRTQRKQQLQGASKPQDRPPALAPVDKQQRRISEPDQQQQQQLQRMRRRSSVSDQHSQMQQQQHHQQQHPLPPAAFESQPSIAQGATGGGSTAPPTPAATWATAARAQSSMLPHEHQAAAPAEQQNMKAPTAAAGTSVVNSSAAHATAPAHTIPSPAVNDTAAPAPDADAGLVPVDSVAAEVDDTLDFGDDDDDEAAAAVALGAVREAGGTAAADTGAGAGAVGAVASAVQPVAHKVNPASDTAAPAVAAQDKNPPVADQQQATVQQEQPTQQHQQAEPQHHEEEHEEHLLSGITEVSADDESRHRHEEHAAGPGHGSAAAPAATAPPPAKPLAAAKPSTSVSDGSKPAASITSSGRPQLKRGKVLVPYPPPPATAAAAAPRKSGSRPTSPGSRSRSRGRSRSRSRGHSRGRSSTSRSLSRGRSRRRSSSRSRGRGRRGSSSRGRSVSPCNRRRHSSSRGRSRSRSRRSSSSRSSSKSRDRSRDRRSRSRDRSRRRSRSGTSSRSPNRDGAVGSRRNSYQGPWQCRNSGDHGSYQQQQPWQKGSGRPGGPVYTNFKNRGRGGMMHTNNRSGEWAPADREPGTSNRGGRGGRSGFGAQQNGGRGFVRLGTRHYGGQYGQFGPRDRNEQQQHDGEDGERIKTSEQQHAGTNDQHLDQQHQQQHEGGKSPPGDAAAADGGVHGSDSSSYRAARGGRANGRGRGRGRGPPAAANGAGAAAAPYSSPGQDGAVVEGAFAPRILGKDGGKYDWPPKEPKDCNGITLHATAAAAESASNDRVNHLDLAASLHPRPHPRPMVRKCPPTPMAAAAADLAMSGLGGGAGPQRQSVFQRLGDAAVAAAAAAAGGSMHHDLPSSQDRWQPRDDDMSGPVMSPGPGPVLSPKGSAKPLSPRAAAAAGRTPGSGHVAVVKRKLGPCITDLGVDSSNGGGSPALLGTKKARGDSPAHSSFSA